MICTQVFGTLSVARQGAWLTCLLSIMKFNQCNNIYVSISLIVNESRVCIKKYVTHTKQHNIDERLDLGVRVCLYAKYKVKS